MRQRPRTSARTTWRRATWSAASYAGASSSSEPEPQPGLSRQDQTTDHVAASSKAAHRKRALVAPCGETAEKVAQTENQGHENRQVAVLCISAKGGLPCES